MEKNTEKKQKRKNIKNIDTKICLKETKKERKIRKRKPKKMQAKT